MEIAITVLVFGIAALVLLFFLARRMLRLAVRLALFALLVLILVAGALFWWWSGPDISRERAVNRNTTNAPSRRAANSR